MRAAWVLLLLLGESPAEARRKKKPTRQATLILVDDIDDRWSPHHTTKLPVSAVNYCNATKAAVDARPTVPTLGVGADGCTLRAALELASTTSMVGKTRVLLRAGRFRLGAQLPEIKGVVEIIGSAGRRKPRSKPKPIKASLSTSGEALKLDPKEIRRLEQKQTDELDDTDLRFQKASTGQTGPIGTVIDGEQRFQLFRTAAASELRLMDIRLENGMAVETSEDPRTSLGGAINAFGTLYLSNVVMRNNRAINGGAIYTEAPLDAFSSLFEHNVAEKCGGMLYAAAFGGDRKINGCSLQMNQELSCTHQLSKEREKTGAGEARGKVAARRARSGKTVYEFADEDDEPPPPPEKKPGEQDATGAIYEGPRLCGIAKPSVPPKKKQQREATAKGGSGHASDLGREEEDVVGGPSRSPRRRPTSTGERYDPRQGVKPPATKSSSPPTAPPPRVPKKVLPSVQSVLDELDRISKLPEKKRRDDYDDDDVDDDDDDDDFDDFMDFDEDDDFEARWERRQRNRRAPPSPPEPPKECHPERHGGEDGGVHDLSCTPGLWRTGRKQATECVIWRSTFNCSGIDGDRNPQMDKGCYEFIPDGESGFCECAGGKEAAHTDCRHEPFTCEQECRKSRESRRRRKNAERRARGEPTLPRPGPLPKLYAIGAYGQAGSGRFGVLDGIGLFCSDGSRTSMAGSTPSSSKSWEFVCPGWQICRDQDDLCRDWAKRGECLRNPQYMRSACMQSCNTCPEIKVPENAQGLVGLDVRAGKFVDAIRLQCSPPEPDEKKSELEEGEPYVNMSEKEEDGHGEIRSEIQEDELAALDGLEDDDELHSIRYRNGVYIITSDGETVLESELDVPDSTDGDSIPRRKQSPRNLNLTFSS
ncbi:MAG: hypothetical protein SGPRY_000499, partial [Prymnesium sp.]